MAEDCDAGYNGLGGGFTAGIALGQYLYLWIHIAVAGHLIAGVRRAYPKFVRYDTNRTRSFHVRKAEVQCIPKSTALLKGMCLRLNSIPSQQLVTKAEAADAFTLQALS